MEYDLDLILDVFIPPTLGNQNDDEESAIQAIDTFSAADVADLCHGMDWGNNNFLAYLSSIAIVSSQFSDQYKSIVKQVLHQRRHNKSISQQHFQFFQMFFFSHSVTSNIHQ
jgi:hypothetical protein